MDIEDLKTLWAIRFRKIKKMEAGAAWGYQDIRDFCLIDGGGESKVTRLLKQLVTEERGHEKIADQLIAICHRNHPEFGVMEG